MIINFQFKLELALQHCKYYVSYCIKITLQAHPVANNRGIPFTFPAMTLTLLAIIAIAPPTILADLHRDGMPVILQTDVKAVIIKSNLSIVTNKLTELDRAIQEIRGRTGSLDQNQIKTGRKDLALLSRSIDPLSRLCDDLKQQLGETLGHGRVSARDKRAIEFLGSALNWITGVPTAADHRKVLEQVKRIRLDEVTAVNDMKHQNEITSKTIKHLQVQETEIASLARKIAKLRINEYEGAGISIRTIAILYFSNQVQQMASSIRSDISHIERVLVKSDLGLLDRSAISVSNLSSIIDQIFLQQRNSTPVFQREDCQYYYTLPLAHSWVSEDSRWLMTLLQVPITPVGAHNILSVLDPLNKIFIELPMAVVNQNANTFRYMSLSDVAQCHHLTSHLLCAKREIEIVPAHGCSLQLKNCRVWATNVVHDISNTEIILILSEKMAATMSCDNRTVETIDLPIRSIIRLATSCQITTKSFIVKKISYRHLSDIQSDVFKDEPISIISDNDVIMRKLNIGKEIPSDELPKLKTLLENNGDLLSTIRENEARSRSLWENISGGQTPIEQILVWSFLALSLVLSVLSISLHAAHKFCKKTTKIKEDGEGEETLGERLGMVVRGTDKDADMIQDLNKRLINLETTIMRLNPNRRRLMLQDGRHQEELDV